MAICSLIKLMPKMQPLITKKNPPSCKFLLLINNKTTTRSSLEIQVMLFFKLILLIVNQKMTTKLPLLIVAQHQNDPCQIEISHTIVVLPSQNIKFILPLLLKLIIITIVSMLQVQEIVFVEDLGIIEAV